MLLKSITGKMNNVISTMWRRPKTYGGDVFYPIGKPLDMWSKCDPLMAFCEVPEVNAIINMKARLFSSGVLKVVDKNGKESKRSPYVSKLISKPNWFQDQKEFMRQTKLFHDIYGNEYISMLFPVGFKMDRATNMFSLPPILVRAEYTGRQLFFTMSEFPIDHVKYTYKEYGQEFQINPETIIHFNDNHVSYKDGAPGQEFLSGDSKLVAHSVCVQNLRLAYDSLGVILKNRGALGILSNDSKDAAGFVPIKPGEKDEIQEAYRQYGGLAHQHQLIITNASLKWQQMSINPDKLGLFQGKKEDFAKLLDAYGMPMELFVRSDSGSTYENQRQARKGAYQETIIPEANEWVAGLNNALMIDTDDKIVVDYTHLPIFQEDLKARGEAFKALADSLNRMLQDRAITIEEYIEEIERAGVKKHAVKAPEPSSEAKDNPETLSAQAQLRGSVGGVQGVLAIQASVSAGTTTYESAIATFIKFYGLTKEEAVAVLGDPKPQNNGTTQEDQAEPAQGGGGNGNTDGNPAA